VATSALVTGASSVFAAFARRSVTAIAISDAIRHWLVGTGGFAPERVRVKYDGVARPEQPLDLDAAASHSFLFAGRVAEDKGIPLLLDAWRAAEVPNGTRLRIVGDGHLRDMVAAAAASDARIEWLGQVPPAETRRLMGEARCIVVPSRWEEPFGRSAAEAMARGRPVITTGLGGLGEVVDGTSGWVVGDDAGALARAVTEASRSDDAVGARGAAAARRYDERFSPEVTTRALLDIYTAVTR
jgi:glycosyltransferase involved in cell wall biosynthesis